MRVIFFLVFFMCFVLSGAFAGTDSPIDLQEANCTEADSTTVGMAKCTKKAEEAWDQEMNRYYGLLMKKLTKEQADKLQLAQRAWIEYRDKEFKNIGALFPASEGTMGINIRAALYRNIVKQRALELIEYHRLQDILQNA